MQRAGGAREPGHVVIRSAATPVTVALGVSDDGVGIEDDVLARIEPFVVHEGAQREDMGLGVFPARTFAEHWAAAGFARTSPRTVATPQAAACRRLP